MGKTEALFLQICRLLHPNHRLQEPEWRRIRSLSDAPDVNGQAEKPTRVSEETSREQSPAANALEGAVRNMDDSEQSVCLGVDLLTGSEVRWRLTVKGNPHLLVTGLPGMGNTTCLLNLCKQMLDGGIRPIVFSYHQDIDERLTQLVPAVRFLDFHGLGFNPLQVIDRQSRMAYLDVAGALRDIFVAIYPELGDIQGERIRKAVKDSFVEHGWDDVNADLAGLTEPEFGRLWRSCAEPKPDRGLRTLLGRLEELSDYGFFSVPEIRKAFGRTSNPLSSEYIRRKTTTCKRPLLPLSSMGFTKTCSVEEQGNESRMRCCLTKPIAPPGFA